MIKTYTNIFSIFTFISVLILTACNSSDTEVTAESSGCFPLIINNGTAKYTHTLPNGSNELLSISVSNDANEKGHTLIVESPTNSVSYSLDICGYSNDEIKLPDPVRAIITQGPITQQVLSQSEAPLDFLYPECSDNTFMLSNESLDSKVCTFTDSSGKISYTQETHDMSGTKNSKIPLAGLLSYTEVVDGNVGHSLSLTEWTPY
ncbi:MAG: hypothetical protein ACI96N_003349 [Arenicella sp.]|jgi:hypothetical protein